MVNYIGIGGPSQIGNVKPLQAENSAKKTDEAKSVQFESTLQGVEALQSASSTMQTGRSEQVAALKAQVEAGTYQPNLEEVASSLLNFVVEEK